MTHNKSYRTVSHQSECELIINKSKFYGRAYPVTTEDEVQSILAATRKKYYDATHNCFAYILQSGAARYSDDGEPGGTAGLPMMEVLKANRVSDCLCIVTRYFGGVLLGAGGLVRAYSKSTAMAIDEAGIVDIIPGAMITLCVDYSRFGAIEKYIRENTKVDKIEYLESISISFCVKNEDAEQIIATIIEKTDGRVTPQIVGECYLSVDAAE